MVYLLTLLQWTVQPAPIVYREIFEMFQKYFTKFYITKASLTFFFQAGSQTHNLPSSFQN